MKDLIGIRYVHIVWNVHYEAISLRKEEKGSGGE